MWRLGFYQSLPGVCMHAKSLQSVLLIATPGTVPPRLCTCQAVNGILQAKILEWVAIFFSRGSSQLKDRNHISYIGRQVLAPPGKHPYWVNLSNTPPGMETGLGKTGHQEMPREPGT